MKLIGNAIVYAVGVTLVAFTTVGLMGLVVKFVDWFYPLLGINFN
jgi:hypothetical protein